MKVLETKPPPSPPSGRERGTKEFIVNKVPETRVPGTNPVWGFFYYCLTGALFSSLKAIGSLNSVHQHFSLNIQFSI